MSYEEIEVEAHGRWNRDKRMNGRRPALADTVKPMGRPMPSNNSPFHTSRQFFLCFAPFMILIQGLAIRPRSPP